jgi:hypothetical protein
MLSFLKICIECSIGTPETLSFKNQNTGKKGRETSSNYYSKLSKSYGEL